MPRHYLTPTATQRRLGLVCLGVGESPDCRQTTPERVLDCHAVVLITSGSGELRSGSGLDHFPITAPSVFFLHPGVRHCYRPNPEGWHERWVLFDGPAGQAYGDLGYLPRTPPTYPLGNPLPALRVFEQLTERCRPDNPQAEVETAALVHHLLGTLPRCRASTDADGSALAALRENAASTLSLPEHARRLGLTVPALRALVRRSAGCTPREYLLRVRLNQAKTLLAESNLPIAAVARAVGYDDPAYFSRLFTRRTGSPPRDFRERESRGTAGGGSSRRPGG